MINMKLLSEIKSKNWQAPYSWGDCYIVGVYQRGALRIEIVKYSNGKIIHRTTTPIHGDAPESA